MGVRMKLEMGFLIEELRISLLPPMIRQKLEHRHQLCLPCLILMTPFFSSQEGKLPPVKVAIITLRVVLVSVEGTKGSMLIWQVIKVVSVITVGKKIVTV